MRTGPPTVAICVPDYDPLGRDLAEMDRGVGVANPELTAKVIDAGVAVVKEPSSGLGEIAIVDRIDDKGGTMIALPPLRISAKRPSVTRRRDPRCCWLGRTAIRLREWRRLRSIVGDRLVQQVLVLVTEHVRGSPEERRQG